MEAEVSRYRRMSVSFKSHLLLTSLSSQEPPQSPDEYQANNSTNDNTSDCSRREAFATGFGCDLSGCRENSQGVQLEVSIGKCQGVAHNKASTASGASSGSVGRRSTVSEKYFLSMPSTRDCKQRTSLRTEQC